MHQMFLLKLSGSWVPAEGFLCALNLLSTNGFASLPAFPLSLANIPLTPETARDQERRIRREIANSNERRRMQSINAGFQSLKTLIPHSDGEKLSKVGHKLWAWIRLGDEFDPTCFEKAFILLQLFHILDFKC